MNWNIEAYTMWEKEHVKYELKCWGIVHVGKRSIFDMSHILQAELLEREYLENQSGDYCVTFIIPDGQVHAL